MTLEEIFKENKAVQFGIERYYYSPIETRDWDLENVTPSYLVVEEKIIDERTWVHTIQELAQYLQEKYPKSIQELLNYRVDWSKASIYSETKSINNMVSIQPNLYVSVNFTARHSGWFIQDLLTFYNIDKNDCFLIVHKPPRAEPAEVQKVVESQLIDEFKLFLVTKGLCDDKIDNIVRGIKSINKLLDKMNCSYNNFFLFDNLNLLSTIKSRLFQEKYKFVVWNEKQDAFARECLSHLTNFFNNKKRTWEEAKNDNIFELIFIKPNGKAVTVDIRHIEKLKEKISNDFEVQEDSIWSQIVFEDNT